MFISDLFSRLTKREPLTSLYLIGIRIIFRLRFIIGTLYLSIVSKKKYRFLDFNKICSVNPQKIQHYINNKKYYKWHISSRILDGDWDQTKISFENLTTYKASKKNFKEGKRWEETELYHLIPSNFPIGTDAWTFKNEEARDKYILKIELLYEKIKNEGYITQKRLNSFFYWFIRPKWEAILDEIVIGIGRNGELIFINGKHRLSIAKILELPKVPIIILLRHRKWMELRKNLINISKKTKGRKYYLQLTHPDLQDISFNIGERSFELIKENISFTRGKLIDIEANFGYFCHRFEDEGFECVAVEENRLNLYFLKKLRKAENKKFKIISESIFEYYKNGDLNFDVVLGLNLYHHFSEEKSKLIDLLKKLKTKEFFIAMFEPFKFRIRKANRTNHFINFIVENSRLNKVIYIGKMEDGRSIYKLI